MSNTITPESQTRYIDPNQIRIFEYNTQDSKIYLSKNVNYLLNAIGNNIILDGMECHILNFDNNIVNIKVDPGMIIIDSTLITIPETNLVLTYENLNDLPYESASRLIVHLNYQYLKQLYENNLVIKLSYINNNLVLPDGWQTNRDNIIIGIFEYTLDENNNILSVIKSNDTNINFSEKTYYLNGYCPENIHFNKIFHHLNTLLFTDVKIDDLDLPSGNKVTHNVSVNNPGFVPKLTNTGKNILKDNGEWSRSQIMDGVNTINDLKAITNVNKDNVIIFVKNIGLYVYDMYSTESDDNIHIIRPNDNIGRYKRIGIYI